MLLKTAIKHLGEAQTIIEAVKNYEEEALENLPEGMKEGEKGEKMGEAVEALGSAYDSVEEAVGYIYTASE